MMQTNIIQICAVLYELPLKPAHLYSNINCRIEIYNVLFAIVMTPHHLCPPPTEMALAIIQTVFSRDDSVKVRTHCRHIIKNFEKLVHPQKESLLFAIEARDIRNTFIKMGQENLLSEFGINFTNANIVKDNNVVDHNNFENLNSTNESIHNSENDEIENNEQQPPSNPESENVESLQNAYTESTVINDRDNVDDTNIIASTDNIATESDEKENNDDLEVNVTNTSENVPKSPEIILRVEDDGEITKVDEKGSSMEEKIEEPVIKKQKLDHEDVGTSENVTDEVDKISHLNSMEDDEENLLAEIASQFVDELD